jgi:hypothetical protein
MSTIIPENFTKISHDINGNPRYVIHFLNFITPEEYKNDNEWGFLTSLYKLACKRANKWGGRKFSNRQYGGGIVFTSYNIRDTCDFLNRKMDELNKAEVK